MLHHEFKVFLRVVGVVQGFGALFFITMKNKTEPYMIEEIVTNLLGVKLSNLRGKCKEKELVIARQIIWENLYRKERLTLKAIGKRFNRHHSTILHGLREFQDKLVFEDSYANLVVQTRLEEELR